MTPLPTPPPAAGRRLHRLARRRAAVVTTVLVAIVGAPLVVGAVANDDGSAVPTGATVVAVETPAEPTPEPQVQVDMPAVAAVAASDVVVAAVVEPELDMHALLTDPYSWDEHTLRVAALQQVLNVEVDGRYDAVTRRFHLDFLELAALSTDGVPDEAPPGPSPEEWAALRDCESGGDYSIASSSGRYRGAYQFVQSTWDSVAGRNDPTLVGIDPADAAPTDQDAMARALYREEGRQPWPVCGRHLS